MTRPLHRALVLLVLSGAVGAEAAPVPPPTPVPFTLRIRADVAATLRVDGRRAGVFAPGETLTAGLTPGQHLVEVLSQGGETAWEALVDTATGETELFAELAGEVEKVRRDYVRIPAGTFEMGCVVVDPDCGENEVPRHTVSISRDFWMMKTEVTVAAYKAAMAENGQAMPEATDVNPDWSMGDHPMMNVTWHQAAGYCAQVGGRLPTEAEWEYAARGGIVGGLRVWGDAPVPIVAGKKQANVGDKTTSRKVGCPMCGFWETYDDGYFYTAPVASFAPNGFGLYDMAGNIEEWMADWYRDRSYDGAPAVDPKGSPYGRWRVLRGGSWSIGPGGHRLSGRGGFPPDRTTDNFGMRCVREIVVP